MTYIKNAWYCAGFSGDVTDAPVARKMLGENIVLYRAEGGKLAAIDGRCPHRFAPLASGRVVDGAIECPYHGLRFAADGRCVLNPHGDQTIAPTAHLTSYPAAEKDGVLWVWMGDANLADPGEILATPKIADPSLRFVTGMFVIDADYQLVLDNLLDLSHARYIHVGTLLGAPPPVSERSYHKVSRDQDVVHSEFLFADFPPSPQMSPLWDGAPVGDAWALMSWHHPANVTMDGRFCAAGADRDQAETLLLPSLHLLTPIADKKTAYFFASGRNRLLEDRSQDQHQLDVVGKAFGQEDIPMIVACQDMMGDADLFDLKPLVLESDKAAVLVRRQLQRSLREELMSA